MTKRTAVIQNRRTGEVKEWHMAKGEKESHVLQAFADYYNPYGVTHSKGSAEELYKLIKIHKEEVK